jgi:antitoxin ParD1/3/4
MTLNVSLTPQLEELVKAKVSSGMYNSASELVREALRLLDERDQVREMRLQALRKAVQEGIDSLSLNPDTVVNTWLRLAGKSV